jgi:hypothetical protein
MYTLVPIITPTPKIPVDSIMIPVYAKICMTPDTVSLVIVVSICMIAVMIKRGGNWKRISKKQKGKDGNV